MGWNPVAASKVYFWRYFWPNKEWSFCPVFVFQRGMSIGMLKYILYFKNEGLIILWISQYNSILGLKNGFHNAVFYLSLAGRNLILLICDGSIRHLGGKFRQKLIYLFWVFWSLIFYFFPRRTYTNVTELVHCIIVF